MGVNSTAVRRSALYHRQSARGTPLAIREGWEHFFDEFSDAAEPRRNPEDTRVVDISPLRKWDVQGQNAGQWLTDNLPECAHMTSGQVRFGGWGVCACLAPDVFTLRAGPENLEFSKLITNIENAKGISAFDVTALFTTLAVLGRHARAILARLTSVDLGLMTGPQVTTALLANVRTRILHLPLADGSSIYELYVERSYAEYVWDSLLEAGVDLGLGVAGFSAWERAATGLGGDSHAVIP